MKPLRSPVDQRGATSSNYGAVHYHNSAAKWKYSSGGGGAEKSPVSANGQQHCGRSRHYPPQSNFPPSSPITITTNNSSSSGSMGRVGERTSSMSHHSLSSSCSSARSTPSNQTTSLSSSFTSQTDENTSQNSAPWTSRDFAIIDVDDEVFASMRMEIEAAVDYLTYLLIKAQFNVDLSEFFRQSLTVLLMHHYAGHWYPDDPLRGSGYRCLRVNGVMHPLLANAAEVCAIPLTCFRRAFPAEFTLWIDPGNVNVRIGEDGSIGAFSKCDTESSGGGGGGGSLSPYFFNHGFSSSSSASASPAHRTSFYNALTPMAARPTTTNTTVYSQRPCLSRTRLFQQQTQAHSAKELSPLPKTSETSLRSSGTKHEKSNLKASNVGSSTYSRVRSSPVIGYRSEDHGFVEHSNHRNNSLLSQHDSAAPLVVRDGGLSRRTTASFQLCPNIHVGNSKNCQQQVVPVEA